jgi:hypothetical protein
MTMMTAMIQTILSSLILQAFQQTLTMTTVMTTFIFQFTINVSAMHSVNLIAITDADKALQIQAYSKIYHTSSGKIQAIWNAVHRSTKAADSISDVCKGKKLSVLCPTRWNSRFDAVQRLLEFRYQLG